MDRGPDERTSGVRLLDAGGASLAAGIAPSPRGTLYFRSARGGIVAPSGNPMPLLFGRDEENVHVPVGVGDRHVSRRQGRVAHDGRRWVIDNEGRLPLQLPSSVLVLAGGSAPLPAGYTPIVVRHKGGPAHVIEVFVAPEPADGGGVARDEPTARPAVWTLSATERLALIVLGRRYLRHERYAQPLSWNQAAEDLATITGDPGWGSRRVERLVEGVRKRLSDDGVPGLTRDEVGEPVGNTLNHNLLTELLLSTTLVPPDLVEVDVLDW